MFISFLHPLPVFLGPYFLFNLLRYLLLFLYSLHITYFNNLSFCTVQAVELNEWQVEVKDLMVNWTTGFLTMVMPSGLYALFSISKAMFTQLIKI